MSSIEEEQQQENIYDLDLVIKFYLKSNNNSNCEIYYPNYRQNPVYLKNIIYKLKKVKEFNQGSLCNQLLGIYPDLAYDLQSKKNRIIIKGFLPKYFTYKHKYQLKIGDLIVSINNIEVDADNIEGLLYVLNRNESIVLTTISSLNYQLNHSTNTTNQLLTYNGVKTVASSKSTQVVQGDRINNNNTTTATTNDSNLNNQEDITYLIMVLAFDSSKEEKDSNEMKDIVYKYPRNENEINRKLTNINELIKTIRGLFVTLSFTIKDIDSQDESVICYIEHQDQLYHVCFLHKNYSQNGILILIIPLEQISLNYLKILAKNLNNTFKFTFGSLFNKLIDDKLQYRLNDHEKNAINSEFDAFFSQLKQRFLYLNQSQSNYYSNFLNRSTNTTTTPLAQQQQIIMQRQQDNLRRMNLLIEMRYKCFDVVSMLPPYFEVPFELKHDVDSILNGLEAQEFVDLENDFYLNRRLFSLIGSCLFYKDYLITTHLNRSRTISIYNYCEHYGFFNLIRNGCINQTVVWKEIYLPDLNNGRRNKIGETRHFLVLIALKEFLIAVVLENGGNIARHIDTNQLIEPNPFYIQQVTYVMNDLYDSGLMSEINRYFNFNCGNKQIVFNINKFLKVKQPKEKQQQIIKQREHSNSRSPTRLATILRSKSNDKSLMKMNKDENKFVKQASINLVDNIKISDLEINNEFVYQSNKEYRHKSPINPNRSSFADKEYIRYFNDISLNDSIIYYASNTNNTNGIIFSPKKYDYNSSLFLSVFSNYIQSCFKIKNLFDKISETDNRKTETLIEQGVLFNIILTDEKLEQLNNKSNHNSIQMACTSAKIKELNFWVVGRRRLKQINSKWISLGDFFICFHDAADQILIELAFDIGMCKMAI